MKNFFRFVHALMIVLFCVAFWSERFLWYTWSLIPVLVICAATEITLFAKRQARWGSLDESTRQRTCIVLYQFVLIIADPWTTVTTLGYAAMLRMSEARRAVIWAHVLGIGGTAAALLLRHRVMYEAVEDLVVLRVVDLLAMTLMAATIMTFLVWRGRRSAQPLAGEDTPADTGQRPT